MELILFTRKGCYECAHSRAQMDELKHKHNIECKEIDAERDPLAHEYNINKIPTILITKSGFELHRFCGLAPLSVIERKIQGELYT